MSVSNLSLIFQSSSALALLMVVFLVWRAHLRTDEFRQRLFAIRDEIFDYANSGHIGFRDPAYQLLRNSMNGFIRYAHRLTFFQLMVTIVRWKVTEQVHPLTWHERWTAALDSLPDGRGARLQEFHGRAMDAVARQLIWGSFVLTALLAVDVVRLVLK